MNRRPDQALVVEPHQVDQPLTVREMQGQVQLIQQVMAEVMQKDTHYGVIPGTSGKPSLLKPGAEKIMATFRLAADPDVLDLSTDDVVRFRVLVRLISPSGRFVGAGVGECSSQEEKYRWKAAVCDAEFEETPADRRREKWRKGYQGKPPYKQQQVRMEAADVANTVLKMAKKRALVDATLTATAASDIFTQDLEDMDPEQREAVSNGSRTPTGNQSAPPDAATQKIIDNLNQVAAGGWDRLKLAWSNLTSDQRAAVGPAFRDIKAKAEAAGGGSDV